MRFIDDLLNRITMYRLVLYVLLVLWTVALVFSFFGVLHYGPVDMLLSAGVIVGICWLMNELFTWAFKAPSNVESWWITAFILTLIVSPVKFGGSVTESWFLLWVCVLAIASKFILAIGKKHIFNPAAFGILAAAYLAQGSASWWIGTGIMMPFVLVGGLLVARKVIRWDLVLTFFAVTFGAMIMTGLARSAAPLAIIERVVLDSPIFFFAFIMLTEPLTTPPTRTLRILYGALVGALFVPGWHLGPLFSTPESALILGNLFSYIVSPRTKLILTLKEKNPMGPDMYDLVFIPNKKLKFVPGQYLEWTLGHHHPDTRGNRRYFTVASSPTEPEVRLGVKFYPESSTFKKALLALEPGGTVVASQLSGSFTLPKDPNQKLVLIAGGIGITPYRSMAKYLIDTQEKRDAVLLYSAKTAAEHVYKDIFDAAQQFGIQPVYVETDKTGFITGEFIQQQIPDYRERMFYLSGPRSMVVAFEDTLKKLGVPRSRIKKDFFPGFV